MDKTTWLQKSKEERVAQLNELLSKLVELIKSQRKNIRTRTKEAPGSDRRKFENQIMSIIEWEKEEND